VVLIAGLLGSGIYMRIRDVEETDAVTEEELLRPIVSAMEAFPADIANPVTVAEVVRDTLVMRVTAQGEAYSFQSVGVRSQVSGRVVEVRVRENDLVPAGEIVVVVDTTDLLIALERARLQYRQSEVSFAEQSIADDRITDPALRAEREANLRIRSGLAQAELTLREAERNLENARVKVPFAGRIADINVVPGQWIGPGDELMKVVRTDPIRFDAYVLDTDLQHIAPGRGARVEFRAYPGERFEGRIETINPVVDGNRRARVTISIPNPDGRILVGMYGEVSLDARRYPDRILVPKSAVIERDRSPVVFVYQGDERGGVAMWRYVRRGLENDEQVEILYFPGEERSDPLEPGELVLTSGHATLVHQAQVRIVDNVLVAGGRPE
ncbi:MAG TPA: efflux RND transporter periplasmic adaptor subunit, partial [Longimicrobiales bacterium]|nr:efflux RND transporter periplasmic adaptor subunit [Longimicrobiales bacterium]